MNGWKKHLGAALLSLACAQAWAVPTLSISPTPASAAPGASFGVDVRVTDIADLYAYNFSLGFDAALLRAAKVSFGTFLESSGVDTIADVVDTDNNAGLIYYAYGSLLGPDPGVSGSGLLLHIDFSALAAGTSALRFQDVLFLDSHGNDIAVKAVDGAATIATATAVPEPASWMLIGLGAAAAGALRRRRSVRPA